MTEPALDDLQVWAFLHSRGPPQFEARGHLPIFVLLMSRTQVTQEFYSASVALTNTNLNQDHGGLDAQSGKNLSEL
jgi:hypothetical protein